MRRVLVIAGTVVLCAACETRPEPTSVFEPGEVVAGDWPFWPDSMRVHPLTRVMAGGEEAAEAAILEARIEFLDPGGITTRGFGQLRLDLHDAERRSEADYLEQWNIDLRDVALNLLHFDDVTRTYLFKLEIPRELLPAQTELRAYYLGEDGETLSDQRELREWQ